MGLILPENTYINVFSTKIPSFGLKLFISETECNCNGVSKSVALFGIHVTTKFQEKSNK